MVGVSKPRQYHVRLDSKMCGQARESTAAKSETCAPTKLYVTIFYSKLTRKRRGPPTLDSFGSQPRSPELTCSQFGRKKMVQAHKSRAPNQANISSPNFGGARLAHPRASPFCSQPPLLCTATWSRLSEYCREQLAISMFKASESQR